MVSDTEFQIRPTFRRRRVSVAALVRSRWFPAKLWGADGIFANEGIIGGSGVQSVLWQKSKAAKKENRKTLNKTGTLQRSIHRTDAENGTVTVGTNAPYGAYHRSGLKNFPNDRLSPLTKKRKNEF